MKSVISLLNKLNYQRRQIHHFGDVLDGIVFAQLQDEYLHTDFKRQLWNSLTINLQKIRIKNNLEVINFEEEMFNSDWNQELAKFIRCFLETLLTVKKHEIIDVMLQLPIQCQQEIANFMQNDFEDLSGMQDIGQLEFQTTSTIISLEENLNSKENIITQQNKKIEQIKQEYQNLIQDQQAKLEELAEINEKLYDAEIFFLQKLNCSDFEEAWNKFQEFVKELENSKQQIEELTNLIQNQQKEIGHMRQKNQQLKCQLTSNPPTNRTIEYEQIIMKDPQEQKTIQNLQQQIQGIKEENLRILGIKQTQYESELTKLRRKLYESEQETASYKKKFEKLKFELDEYMHTNQIEKKNVFESLRHQGIYSSNNSYLIEFDQKYGQSPKSTCFDFFQAQNKLDIDHGVSHSQITKQSEEINMTKLQALVAEKSNKILQLERQLNQYQQSSHSRRNSMTKFNQNQQERHFDQQSLLENLRFYVQYSQQKDLEIKEIKEQQNSNFLQICKQIIKQNEQIQKLNSLIIKNPDDEQIQELNEKHQDEIQNLHQYYVSALNNKDEIIQLVISLFYDNQVI